MKTRFVNTGGCDPAQAARDLHADRQPAQQIGARQPMPLACRDDSGNDHRSRVNGPALESVVEVFTVRCGSVDERRAFDAKPVRMADDRARPVLVNRR